MKIEASDFRCRLYSLAGESELRLHRPGILMSML